MIATADPGEERGWEAFLKQRSLRGKEGFHRREEVIPGGGAETWAWAYTKRSFLCTFESLKNLKDSERTFFAKKLIIEKLLKYRFIYKIKFVGFYKEGALYVIKGRPCNL